ncbi:MAG TPA: hypothetical protein DCZ91_14540 [Lachnospiraceae bacterium]|nr:hypothetical protein [Lachnospiraceae bacterium]
MQKEAVTANRYCLFFTAILRRYSLFFKLYSLFFKLYSLFFILHSLFFRSFNAEVILMGLPYRRVPMR